MIHKRLPLLLLIIFAIFLTAGFMIFRSRLAAPSPHLPPNLDDKPINQAMQEVIELNLKEQFWPKQYDAAKEDSSLVRLGFGRRYADNYKLDWRDDDSYFLSFIGYRKNRTDRPIGYVLNIYMHGVEPTGPDAARIYLKDLPAEGWIRSSPKAQDGFTSEISSVIWQEGRNKVYLEVLSLAYEEPQSGFFPEQPIKEITAIRLVYYMPGNPIFGDIEEIQHGAHLLYGP